jgi:hypothetical protein
MLTTIVVPEDKTWNSAIMLMGAYSMRPSSGDGKRPNNEQLQGGLIGRGVGSVRVLTDIGPSSRSRGAAGLFLYTEYEFRKCFSALNLLCFTPKDSVYADGDTIQDGALTDRSARGGAGRGALGLLGGMYKPLNITNDAQARAS